MCTRACNQHWEGKKDRRRKKAWEKALRERKYGKKGKSFLYETVQVKSVWEKKIGKGDRGFKGPKTARPPNPGGSQSVKATEKEEFDLSQKKKGRRKGKSQKKRETTEKGGGFGGPEEGDTMLIKLLA